MDDCNYSAYLIIPPNPNLFIDPCETPIGGLDMEITAITNVRVFDGHTVHENTTVLIADQFIGAVSPFIDVPANSTVIDGTGCTLLPGLIDAHTHSHLSALEVALRFGVTTELEMMGYKSAQARREIEERDDLADLRTAGFALTAPGGHPSELKEMGAGGLPPGLHARHAHHHVHGGPSSGAGGSPQAPTASTPDEAAQFVVDRLVQGSDYIKIMIEEGSVLAHPGLPLLSNETLVRAVDTAHLHGKMAIAHALTAEATMQALNAGVDGLAHVFLDSPHNGEIVRKIKETDAFVTPCICLNASIMGFVPDHLAADGRVGSRLDGEWLSALRSSFNTYPQGDLGTVFRTVKALHDAGVDILAGTDASVPTPALGGIVHGASVHHELQLLVQAGLSPVEALKAATSTPARRFGLLDRGVVENGKQADLLLVEGNPTVDISNTLNIREIWRRGVRLGP